VPTIIGPISGSFVVEHLPAVRSGPFIGSRPFPAIPSIFLQDLFQVGAKAFVGCLAVEPGLRNKYSFGYLIPINDPYTVTDISIRPNLL